jgi:Spy/CpxP family protein refolding chaperone
VAGARLDDHRAMASSMIGRTRLLAMTLALAAAGGCAGRSANAPPPASAGADDDDDVLAGLFEHHRYHHHGGATLFVAMSLDTIGVSPEQRAAVEKIRARLHGALAPARAAEENLVGQLADGLAASRFDTAKIDAATAQVATAAATAHDAAAAALNELHAALTPPQRAALVDKVEAHWAVWQKANAHGASADNDRNHLAALTKDLELTPDQVAKIRAGLSGEHAPPPFDPQEMTTHLRAFGDAFRSDSFDATKLSANGANQRLAAWGAAHLAHFLETVSPVLEADQRAELVSDLREHAGHGPTAQVNP